MVKHCQKFLNIWPGDLLRQHPVEEFEEAVQVEPHFIIKKARVLTRLSSGDCIHSCSMHPEWLGKPQLFSPFHFPASARDQLKWMLVHHYMLHLLPIGALVHGVPVFLNLTFGVSWIHRVIICILGKGRASWGGLRCSWVLRSRLRNRNFLRCCMARFCLANWWTLMFIWAQSCPGILVIVNLVVAHVRRPCLDFFSGKRFKLSHTGFQLVDFSWEARSSWQELRRASRRGGRSRKVASPSARLLLP